VHVGTGVDTIRWHVWRIDWDFFGIQNVGQHTAHRVTVQSSRNEVIAMGYVVKGFVESLEWFTFAIAREFQMSCDEIIVTWRSGKTKYTQYVSMVHAVRQLPSMTTFPQVSVPPDRWVYRPPQY